MILQKIKKSIEKIGIPCFLDYNDATSYCAVLIPETNGKESIKVDIQFIWEDGNPILLADEWIKSLRMNKELKVIVLGSENNYAGFVLRVKVIDVSICSYIPTGNRYTITIENDPAKGTVSGAGKYWEGDICTLTATPNEQYYFGGWLTPDDDVVHENPYSFTVEGDATYETYYLNKYHVVVQSSGNGTATGTGYYEPTDTCTITATPNTGYHFVNWTVNGLELTTNNPYSFVPTGDITITANFAINTYIISTSGTGGTITGSGTYNYGATCTLTATDNPGYEFRRWMEYGETISTSNPYSFTVNSDRTITADFNQLSYTVSATSSGNGSVSGGGTYHYGDTVNLSATPDAGYAFSDWIESGSTVSSSNPYSFTCTGNRTLVGNFVLAANPLVVICDNFDTENEPRAMNLVNSNDEVYTWNLSPGTNTYTGTEPGFALNEITSIKKSGGDWDWFSYITSIDASGLESWTAIESNAFFGADSLTSIILPDTITTMGSHCFSSCERLPSMTLPSSLTYLGIGVFANDYNLTSITLPEGLITIDQNAFNNSGLTSLSIPSSVVNISSNSFLQSSSLTSITVDPNNITYDSRNNCNCIIETSTNTIIFGCNNSTIPNTVVAIGNAAFAYFPGITSISIPASVSSIDRTSFMGCPSISTITVDANNQYYNDGNGSNCIIETATNTLVKGGKNTIIPNTVVSIGGYAFDNISGLTSIDIPIGVLSIGWAAFNCCSDLTSIDLPEGLTTIYEYAFAYCYKLHSVNLPNSLTTIKYGAFTECTFPSLTIPANVSSIEGYAFNGVILSVDFLGTTPPTLQNNVFDNTAVMFVPAGCKSIYQAAWPDYSSKIREHDNDEYLSILARGISTEAVLYNSNSESIYIPVCDNIETKYYGGFTGFELNEITNFGGNYELKISLVSIDAHALTSWTRIEESAFNGYRELTSFILPSGLTNIGQQSFANCTKLRNITIPATILSMRWYAFDNCPSLSYMEFEGTTPPSSYPSGSAVFGSYVPAIYVPSGSVSTYQSASAWSQYSSYISEKPATPLTDYLRIDANNSSASVIFTNANNDTYTWNLSAGINYYTGTELGFALNEITGLTKNTGNILYVDASKLTSWTTAANSAFSSRGNLYSFIFPDTMTTMGDNVFSDCGRLETIHLSNSITTIGNSAINSLESLLSITIPSTLTSAGNGFLTGCTNMISITCLATTPPTIGQYSLNNTNNCPIYVPSASVSAYKTAPNWSSHASRIQGI